MEDRDCNLYLSQETFVDTVGAIVVAKLIKSVLGCCSLLKHGERV